MARSVWPVLPLAEEAIYLGLCYPEPGLAPADQDGFELAAANPTAHGFRVDLCAVNYIANGQHAFGGIAVVTSGGANDAGE
jgi:hypothetical protein